MWCSTAVTPPCPYKQILSEKEFREAEEQYGDSAFARAMGAEAVLELLKNIDLEKESAEMQEELENASGQKRAKLIKRLEVVESFRKSGNRPEWMILTVVPVHSAGHPPHGAA